ncbi:MAG: ABC transporter ATP-binding protein [Firmicutes bacterium]|nr:ABC transporter ATP-binding protein [Bacillota bacterium]
MTIFLDKTTEIKTDYPDFKDADLDQLLVRVEKLTVTRNKNVLLRDVSFAIAKGEFVALVGKNGVGKTTLLQALVDGDHRGIYQGDIIIDGQKFPTNSVRESAKLVAYVPQMPNISKQMLVFDYVMLGRLPYQSYLGQSTLNDQKIVGEVLEQLSLSGFGARPLGELSGGELQRVVIARALAQKTPFLILDEPTTSLDIHHQLTMMELLYDLCRLQNITILCSLHDVNLAARYCDRITMLGCGTVLADGPPEQVLTKENIKATFNVDAKIYTLDGAVTVVAQLQRNENIIKVEE